MRPNVYDNLTDIYALLIKQKDKNNIFRLASPASLCNTTRVREHP